MYCVFKHSFRRHHRFPWLLFLISGFATTVSMADIQVIESTVSNQSFAGKSEDSRYFSKLARIETMEGLLFSFSRTDRIGRFKSYSSIGEVTSSDLSQWGRFQVWTENIGALPNSINGIALYDFDAEFRLDIHPDAQAGFNPTNVRFVRNMAETTVIFQANTIESLSQRKMSLFISNLVTGEGERIDPVFASETTDDTRLISEAVISGDASRVFILSSLFSDDGGYAEQLMMHDRVTGVDTILLESDTPFDSVPQLFDTTFDGSTLVYPAADNSLIILDVDSGDQRIVTTPGSPLWLDVSDDGAIAVITASGVFEDGRIFDYDQELGDANIPLVPNRRPNAVVAIDLESGNSQVINKYSNFQAAKSTPIEMDTASRSLFMATPSDLSQGRVVYALHNIEFGFAADAAVSGLWYELNRSGQGVSIQVVPDAQNDTGQVIVFWYTTDADGSPLWLIMQGYFQGNLLTGQARRFSGSGFGPVLGDQDISGETWGNLTLEFLSCKSAVMSWQPLVDGYSAGEIQLSRLAYQAGLGCL